MTSPNCKSCMQSCKQVCSGSPLVMKTHGGGGSPNCTIIKRCSSPKPAPTPGCNWVKKCSPVRVPLGPVSPVFGMRRPFHHRHSRRMTSPMRRRITSPMHRRISPYATTVIGRGRGPIRRVSVSPRRVVSPGRIMRRR
jgi:hypothetical protein